MNIIQSIILGIIQGVTEFFPISSSGHLVIFPYFLNWDYIPLYFTVTVHFATLVAVITIFYKEIYEIVKAIILGIFIRNKRNSNQFKLGVFLIIASIPAAIAGYFMNDYVENLFTKPIITAIFLLVTALFLWLGELRGRKIEESLIKTFNTTEIKSPSGKKMESEENILIGKIEVRSNNAGQVRFNFLIAIITGIGQALAILPGISRSGATISFARFFGIKRSEAVRFSFLLSIPVIFGSFLFEIYCYSDIIFNGGLQVAQSLIAGFLSSYLAGLFAIKFVVYLARKRNLNVFAIYCISLALVVFVFYIKSKFM